MTDADRLNAIWALLFKLKQERNLFEYAQVQNDFTSIQYIVYSYIIDELEKILDN